MAMNVGHRMLCGSKMWVRHVETRTLPWMLDGVELGSDTLEIGPGYGANLRELARRTSRLTGLEIDPKLAASLRGRFGDIAEIVHGDGAAMPLPDGGFSAVVSCTMLHHVPSFEAQERLIREAYRVLGPNGTFAGCDGTHNLGFRLIHLGDTYNPISPDRLGGLLDAAGFHNVVVDTKPGELRFRGRKQGPSRGRKQGLSRGRKWRLSRGQAGRGRR